MTTLAPLDIDRADMVSVSAFEIWQAMTAVFAAGKVTLDSHLFEVPVFMYVSYALPTGDQVHEAVDHLTTYQHHYNTGDFACFQFSVSAAGDLIDMGLGRSTIGIVRLDVFDTAGHYLGWHACLLEGDQSGIHFVEPQQHGEASFHDVHDPATWIFPSAGRAEIEQLLLI